MLLVGGVLFLGIDHFVSARFGHLRAEQSAQLAAQVQQLVEAEQRRLDGMAALLAKDADLNHTTYYHLHLEGEREHPQAAVERITRAFALEAVALLDPRGRIIASASGPDGDPPASLLPATAPRGISWQDDRAWTISESSLLREGAAIARLRLARPLDAMVATSVAGALPADVRISRDREVPPGGLRVALTASGGDPVFLDVTIPDTVGRALAEVKRLLAATLAVAGLALALALGVYLRWQLRPLRRLAHEATAVGRGEFGRRLPVQGPREIAGLMDAFNAMTRDLSDLRARERKLAHDEQLSAIGRVAARVAHDMNNPLTVISNTARLMQREAAPDGRLAEDLRLVLHHAERCARAVENLLEYGRPLRMQAVPVDLARAVPSIVERWRSRAPGTRLRCGETRSPIPALVDPLLLEQLLDNLLDNARDATAKGEITVEFGQQAERGAWVRVSDSGPGFSAAALAHLFEPFHTTKRGGTGLGLASCLAIARSHGGDLEIAGGAPGRVTVWLPARDQAESPRRNRA
jgi:signal transduction histidine kinase